MNVKMLLGVLVLWGMFSCASAAVPENFGKIAPANRLDKIAADEELSQYPALDLEDTCKGGKNPKCEAIIDNFCLKACRPALCATHGSIRGMCRLMCEAEDLPFECSKMGPSKIIRNNPWQQQGQWGWPPPQGNPQWGLQPWNMYP